VPRPGHGFQPLGVDLFPAMNALAKAAFADAARFIHHLQGCRSLLLLAEEKLFGVGTGGAIGDIWAVSSSPERPSACVRETVRRRSCCPRLSRFLNDSNFFFNP